MSNKASFSNKIVDRQTKRQVYASSLTEFSLAGWEAFQSPTHTEVSPLLLVQDVPTKITFGTPVLFGRFEHQPQIGSAKFPIWDFSDQKFLSYHENIYGSNTTRLQFVAEAITAASGVSVEVSLSVPTYLTIYRVSKPLVKGTNPQRVVDTVEFYYDEFTRDNGCEIYLTAKGDNINIYDINLYTKNW